ncbi:MAG TPA: AraC family transcriptional regulator [Kiritimatiellia bacterium]|nr:AraC family transcriptional regulator [Kiritimatiellia bacterium]
MPLPGRRVVDRVSIQGEVQPWPSSDIRTVSGNWRGPVHFRVHGVDFNARYLGVHEHSGSGTYPLHTHPHAEFHFTMTGLGTVHIPDRRLTILCRPGDLVVIPPLMAHSTSWSCEPSDKWRVFVSNFDLALDVGQIVEGIGEAVDMTFSPFYEWFFAREQNSLSINGSELQNVSPIVWEIASTISEPGYGIGAEVVAGLIRVISLFSRSLRKSGLADGSHITSPMISKDMILLKARAMLEQSEMLDSGCVARTAKAIGMSESSFIRAFKQAYAITPKQYSLYVLMRRAAAMMIRTDISVKDVAFSLGYIDPSSFSRSFHRYFGVTPTEYQQGQRGP